MKYFRDLILLCSSSATVYIISFIINKEMVYESAVGSTIH